jgi:prepilin-type N-terminal cleavage/methylation domain-containing protein
MQDDKLELEPTMRLKGFTLLELLIVMSVIALLMGILLPHLNRAKEQAFELGTFEAEVDEEGNVRLEIRKTRNALYMIRIDRPRNYHTSIREPYPSGMKLIRRKRHDYILWGPKRDDIGVHWVTVVFEGQETIEQLIRVDVFQKDLW